MRERKSKTGRIKARQKKNKKVKDMSVSDRNRKEIR